VKELKLLRFTQDKLRISLRINSAKNLKTLTSFLSSGLRVTSKHAYNVRNETSGKKFSSTTALAERNNENSSRLRTVEMVCLD
jgi:hypothetical protein